jgi:hypothetical protein
MHGWGARRDHRRRRARTEPGGLPQCVLHTDPRQPRSGRARARPHVRQDNRSRPANHPADRQAQYDAVCAWGVPDHALLERVTGIEHPVFVANGNSDPMILPATLTSWPGSSPRRA